VYRWLGDAFLRTHDLGEARTLFVEAIAKWPSDEYFTRPLAFLYATFGQGREAARTLERYLEKRPDDVNALYLAVQWTYHLHANGAFIHNRAEDLRLARVYADAYAKANGPQLPLVQQWMDYLDKETTR
jgi:predicted Zn-dependent protease